MKKKYFLFHAFFIIIWMSGVESIFAQKRSIDSLLTLLQTDKSDSNKVSHLDKLSINYTHNGLYENAMKYANLELELSRQLNFKKGIASSYNNIGIVYKSYGNYAKSIDYYLKALETAEELRDKKKIAIYLGNIGIIYDYQENFSNALDYFFKSLKINKELKNKLGIAINYNNIGNVYIKEKEYDKALDCLIKAQQIARELKDKSGIVFCLEGIGDVYRFKENYPNALDSYFKALKIAEESEYKTQIADILNNISSTDIKTRKYAEAEKYLMRALKLGKELGNLDQEKKIEETITELYTKTNRHQLALEHFKKAMILKDTLFNKDKEKEITRHEMNYEFKKKENELKAEQNKKDAVTAADKKRQQVVLIFVSCGLFLVFVFAGFIFRSLRITRKQKKIIELQKNEVSQQKDIVEKQKQLVEEHQKEIIDSITYAKRIQTALLTSDEYIKNNLPAEHFILFKPKDIVSGDFYWAYKSPSRSPLVGGVSEYNINENPPQKGELEGAFYMATADCTGHGVPGAFMSMLNISYLNENVIERGIRLPHDILNAQRTEIINALNPPGSTVVSKDGMDCILCVYDFDKMLLHFAAANNPLWLVRKKSAEFGVESLESTKNNSELITQNFELIEYKADKMPVGKYNEGEKPFTLQTIKLQKNDIVYTSTDGFADQFGGSSPSLSGRAGEGSEKKLMKKKFKEELLKIHHLSMTEQKEYLDQFFENWKGNAEQVDDVCVIGVRI